MNLSQQIAALWKKGGANAEAPAKVEQPPISCSELNPEFQHVEGLRILRELGELKRMDQRAASLEARIRELVSPASAAELDVRRIAGAPIGWNRRRMDALEELLGSLDRPVPRTS